MSIRARRWRRQVALLLSGVLVVLGFVMLAPTASAAPPTKPSLCRNRAWFGGTHYCPADIEGVIATKYGVGRRVWFRAIVLDVGSDTVAVGQQRGPFCDQGTCDFVVHDTNASWSGTHRPFPGAVINFFGTTTEGGLKGTGYVLQGFCEDPYRGPC